MTGLRDWEKTEWHKKFPSVSVIQPLNSKDLSMQEFIATLSKRTAELGASSRELNREIAQRKAAEKALRQSERQYLRVREESRRLQQELLKMSREQVSAREEERKEISRELHDVIAQTLVSVNLRLAALRTDAARSTRGLGRKIAFTQRMVASSVDVVHKFARELRPAALDDLGLIAALHTFMKDFIARTGLRVHLTVFADVERLDAARRTVLYRIAQESLTNVARHAKASRVEVSIQKLPEAVGLKVQDDGKAFKVGRALDRNGGNRLGLIGMRERVELMGGTFRVESARGHGTTVRVELPSV